MARPTGIRGYPRSSDLLEFLTGSGIRGLDPTSISPVLLSMGAAAGIETFERKTGRRMIAAQDTRLFDVPNGRILPLGDDLLSATDVSLGGNSLVAGTGYWLLPNDAPNKGIPYSLVRLNHYLYGPTAPTLAYQSISITGLWGYGTSIPEDAHLAMLMYGAMSIWEMLVFSVTGFVTKWTGPDGVSQAYGAPAPTAAWQQLADMTAGMYRRTAQG